MDQLDHPLCERVIIINNFWPL